MKGGIFMAKKKTPDVIDSGTEIVKKKRKPAGMAAALAGDLGQEPGDNTRIVMTNMKFFDMPRVDLKNPDAVRERLSEYFQIYGEADLKPTVAGMAMALGINRRTLWAIANDQPTGGNGYKLNLPDETTDLVKKAYEMLEMSMEAYANTGKINPVMAIFMLKNHWNYQDKTEYVLTPNQQQASDYDAEDIRKRYLSDSTTIDSES
jgi:hypothetical protein